jgi:type IV pilus assembly protein PilB
MRPAPDNQADPDRVRQPTQPADTPGTAPLPGRKRIGQVLIEAGIINEDELHAALSERAHSAHRRERLGSTLVRLGFATGDEVARALADQLGLDFLTEHEVEADPTVGSAVPQALALRHEIVPLRWADDATLAVACVDPTDVVAVDDVRMAAGARTLHRVVVTPATLRKLSDRVHGGGTEEILEAVEEDPEIPDVPATVVEDAPIVRLAERLVQDAVAAGASDVHIEPGAKGTAVRYRIDGVLHRATTVPANASPALLSRLKIMAQMDITERRLPQDGRMRLRSAAGQVDVRASTLPSMHGETLVLRLLRKGDEQLRLGDVGFDDVQRKTALEAIGRSQGLILLTGPTGSGKTSTLYALLRELADDSRNIVTLEDPVEYQLDGVNQTQINARIGLTFPRSLRTVLRQDPDVVMVGEIRDPETAELALQASLTGHLVLSTLHTNDAPGAVVRLRDLGIPSYLVASALTTVIAQRLVRRICRTCARPATREEREIGGAHTADDTSFLMPVGCGTCGTTGYKGRTGLFEVLRVEGHVPELIASHADSTALRQSGVADGMRSLRHHGLAKARAGVTSLPEVLRVTPVDEQGDACLACTQPVEPDFAHCPWCGTNLQPPSCHACDRELRPEWSVCPGCGVQRPRDPHDAGVVYPR